MKSTCTSIASGIEVGKSHSECTVFAMGIRIESDPDERGTKVMFDTG